MDDKYSWVNTHKGIVKYLSTKEDSQQELIELLKSIGISPFNDKSKEGDYDIELSEIDPFTFFCYIHKYGDKRRLDYLQQIAKKIDLETPLSVEGIPTAQAQRVWLFPFKYLRVNNEISRLWSFFKKELKGEINNEVFADVLDITNVAKTKLTEALFYINPEKYLPINGPTKPYIKDELGLDYKFSTYSEYMELLDKIREKIDMPFYELSHEAWVWSNKKKKINYWVFQGNPDKYDFETAFRDGDISAWTVTSHKNKIKPGDKVIIWIAGDKAGCYALADVVSEPLDRASFPESHLWRVDDTSELKAAIDITHNLANNPILKDEIDGMKELANLNVGHQGTNFAATEEEYKAILEMIEQNDKFEETKNKFDSEYGPKLFENFIDNLRKIVSKLNLQPNDERIVYSVRHNRFNFIIGQRYCYNIHLSHPKGVYGYISSKKLSEDSSPFDGPPKAYYNHSGDFSLASEEWEALIATMTKELKKTKKSSYWKSNNKEFENYVFEIEEQAKPPVNNKKMITPTNTILYGPPGTGKTYNTVNKALEIIDSEFLKENIDNRQALNERFRSLRFNPETGEGQVAFITFHQSLSYEDFIEGIKPRKNEGEEVISYEVCDGLFKSIAIKASDKKVVVSFDEIYKEFIGDVMEKETFSLKTPVQKKHFDVRINGSGNCVAIPQTETATQMVVTKNMISDFLVDGTVRDWKPYLSSIAEYIKANYSFKVDKEDNANKPYVIIIDEINRGNISQIFGELITLIEPDKRKGQGEEIEVILPYSKERFSVPSNLHIIGTMNTADRSVEALDTALRRRFSFMEMNPKPEKLSEEEFRCEGIDLERMLKAMNGRIEKLLDRDYCIGHSYFMTIKDKKEPLEELKFIFQNKILPLLQEYFYGDWGKIRLIVGKEFVKKRVSDIKFLDMDGSEDYDEFDERPIYSFTDCDGWTLESFKSIYEQS